MNTYTREIVRAVSAQAAIVHAAIKDHERALGWCRCLHSEMAEATGLTQRQVTHALMQLKAAGLIEERSWPRHNAGRALVRKVVAPVSRNHQCGPESQGCNIDPCEDAQGTTKVGPRGAGNTTGGLNRFHQPETTGGTPVLMSDPTGREAPRVRV